MGGTGFYLKAHEDYLLYPLSSTNEEEFASRIVAYAYPEGANIFASDGRTSFGNFSPGERVEFSNTQRPVCQIIEGNFGGGSTDNPYPFDFSRIPIRFCATLPFITSVLGDSDHPLADEVNLCWPELGESYNPCGY